MIKNTKLKNCICTIQDNWKKNKTNLAVIWTLRKKLNCQTFLRFSQVLFQLCLSLKIWQFFSWEVSIIETGVAMGVVTGSSVWSHFRLGGENYHTLLGLWMGEWKLAYCTDEWRKLTVLAMIDNKEECQWGKLGIFCKLISVLHTGNCSSLLLLFSFQIRVQALLSLLIFSL